MPPSLRWGCIITSRFKVEKAIFDLLVLKHLFIAEQKSSNLNFWETFYLIWIR